MTAVEQTYKSRDEKRTKSYLDTYRADGPERFLQPGRKEFEPMFDNSTTPLPACASLE